MTIKELYEWAKEKEVEDYDIYLDDRDDPTYNLALEIDRKCEDVIL